MTSPDHEHRLHVIRSSAFHLGAKLFLLVFVLETAYGLSAYLGLELGPSWHHHGYVALLLLQSIKALVTMVLALSIVLRWTHHLYFVDVRDRQLIERSGIFRIHERVHDLRNIREVVIHQGLFGKLFSFGSITIVSSASGGYTDKIRLGRIQNPLSCRAQILRCLR